MTEKHTYLSLVFSVLLVLATGCQQEQKAPAQMPRLFGTTGTTGGNNIREMHPDSKYATYEQELNGHLKKKLPELTDRDYAMLAANQAMIFDALGYPEKTSELALQSQAIMTGKVEGEGNKALIAAIANEDAKVFKGECYEIAMLNCVIGLCSLKAGDYETAGIGFRRALEADKMSKEGQREDFALAHWGLGMALIDEDPDQAELAFQKCGYKNSKIIKDENIFFLIGVGRAPEKRLSGLYGEQDSFYRCVYEPAYAKVFVDGNSLGKSFKLIDLYNQCLGVPKSAKDVGQGAKAVGKLFMSALAGAALGDAGQDMVEGGWDVRADTRVCYMLPNEMHVLSARLEPGCHVVNVKFYNAKDEELKRYEQIWNYIRISEKERTFLSVRSEFDRCNIQGPVSFTRISKIKTEDKKNPAQTTSVYFRAVNLSNLKIGDTIRLCHFFTRTQARTDVGYHWRFAPLAYNTAGEVIGYPDSRFRMQDYDVGVIGEAEVISIEKNGELGIAKIKSLTTEYLPRENDMVTNVETRGRLWFNPKQVNERL